MKKLFTLFCVLLACVASVGAQVSFKMTTALPAGADFTFTVNRGHYTVDWGDGNAVEVTSTGQPITGKVAGETVVVTGKAIYDMNCSGQQLTGLIIPATLETLDCSDNQLTTLNMNTAGNLRVLDCSSNEIARISNFGSAKRLEEFIASDNALTSISLGSQPSLTTVWIDNNNCTTLSLSSAKAISSFVGDDNQATKFTQPREGLPELVDLWVANNNIPALELTNSPLLETINVENNGMSTLSLLPASHEKKLSLAFVGGNCLDLADMPGRTICTRLVAGEQMLIQTGSEVYQVGDTIVFPDMTTNAHTQTAQGVTYALMREDGTRLVRGTQTSTTADFAYAEGKDKPSNFVFLKEQEGALHLEATSANVPDVVIKSTPFRVVADKTALQSLRLREALTVTNTGRSVELSSQVPVAVTIYDAAGQLRWQGTLVGRQRVQLGRGVFFINGHKVAL